MLLILEGRGKSVFLRLLTATTRPGVDGDEKARIDDEVFMSIGAVLLCGRGLGYSERRVMPELELLVVEVGFLVVATALGGIVVFQYASEFVEYFQEGDGGLVGELEGQ